jgi:hypothetical protein
VIRSARTVAVRLARPQSTHKCPEGRLAFYRSCLQPMTGSLMSPLGDAHRTPSDSPKLSLGSTQPGRSESPSRRRGVPSPPWRTAPTRKVDRVGNDLGARIRSSPTTPSGALSDVAFLWSCTG